MHPQPRSPSTTTTTTPEEISSTQHSLCFQETFPNIPSKLGENLPNCFGRRLILFLEGWSLFPGRMEGISRQGAAAVVFCSLSSAGWGGARAPSWSPQEGREGQVGTEFLLLLGAVRPTMLRGATLAAQRRPCALLVGGEAPCCLAAKECALGVRYM